MYKVFQGVKRSLLAETKKSLTIPQPPLYNQLSYANATTERSSMIYRSKRVKDGESFAK
ncbi:MAG: hypothetical protein ACLR4P_05415 [Butyribacter sp.]